MIELNRQKHNAEYYSRSQLTNQLALYKSTNWEMLLLAKQLNYSFSVPRFAVLFEKAGESDSNLEKDGEADDSAVVFSEALQMILSGMPDNTEDIFGALSDDRFLVFKYIPPNLKQKEKDEAVKNFIGAVRNAAQTIFKTAFIAYVGSAYTNLNRLHASFDEVQFLSGSPLIRKESDVISIDRHIGEYLVSSLPTEYGQAFLKEYEHNVDIHPNHQRTLLSMVKNRYNMSEAAEELGVHRNTMIQRMNRIQAESGIDPMHNIRSRDSLHIYSVIQSKPIIWNACINIHPNNLLHIGFEHFAGLLEKYTNGQFRLNISVVSSSGDYYPLFEAVSRHEIDFAAVNTSILGSIFPAWPNVLECPFLFETEEEAQYLMEHSILKALQTFLNNSGATILSLWSMGWREFSSAEPVISPADFQNKKVRTLFTSERAESFFRYLGAENFHMNYNDLARAMSAGIIDLQENPYSNILDMHFYLQHKYVTQLQAFYDANAVLCSEASWNSLSEELRQTVLDAMSETSRWLVQKSIEVNRKALQSLEEHGMQLLCPGKAEMDAWNKILDRIFTERVPSSLLTEILKERKRYRDHL